MSVRGKGYASRLPSRVIDAADQRRDHTGTRVHEHRPQSGSTNPDLGISRGRQQLRFLLSKKRNPLSDGGFPAASLMTACNSLLSPRNPDQGSSREGETGRCEIRGETTAAAEMKRSKQADMQTHDKETHCVCVLTPASVLVVVEVLVSVVQHDATAAAAAAACHLMRVERVTLPEMSSRGTRQAVAVTQTADDTQSGRHTHSRALSRCK